MAFGKTVKWGLSLPGVLNGKNVVITQGQPTAHQAEWVATQANAGNAVGANVQRVTSGHRAIGITQPGWAVVGIPGAGNSGGQGAGGGAGAGGGTGNVAANASLKQFTGGSNQNMGSTNIQNAGIAVVGEFLGVDYQTADTKLPEGKSPDAQNMDGMGKGGSLALRPGLISFFPKRNDVAPSAVPTAYKGRSINILSPAYSQSLHMSVACGYDQSNTIGTSLASTIATYVRKVKPQWHPQKDIEHVAPTVVLTDSTAATGVDFSVYMPVAYRANAPQVTSVDQIICRVSGVTYPRDRDGKDDTNSRIIADPAYPPYTNWTGVSTAISDNGGSTTSTGATLYYSFWAVSKLHVSQRASRKVVVK